MCSVGSTRVVLVADVATLPTRQLRQQMIWGTLHRQFHHTDQYSVARNKIIRLRACRPREFGTDLTELRT